MINVIFLRKRNLKIILINSLKKRVLIDGRMLEAEACLNAILTNLNNI